jgi:ABC-type transporter Mla subunit MlaD
MAENDVSAELAAKDERIDELIAQSADLVSDLNSTVADMKRILAAATDSIAEQRRHREEGR